MNLGGAVNLGGLVNPGGFLDHDRAVAPPGWSRWLVPPAALAVHMSIGQVYAWSVFKDSFAATLLKGDPYAGTRSGLPFTLAIVVLGVSAAAFGTTVERRGPRWSMLVAATLFAAGFAVSAAGIAAGWFWLVVLGYGLIGGIGLGIGYISPVSTLIKWFPDRPGLATGLAIMGFGGGALIAAPASTALLTAFGGSGPRATAGGLAATFLTMGLGYAVFMSLGWLLIRTPAAGWQPAVRTPDRAAQHRARQADTVAPSLSAREAVRTPQFWLLWVVLCFNVTAGIGILQRAAPIFQDFFRGQAPAAGFAAVAAGFVSALSLANMLGRFVWSSLSDTIGRKNIYRVYLGAGALLYLLIDTVGHTDRAVFLTATMLILSFYGAGFATAPAYLRDLFGTYQVGAIHGRLLTAWSVAGALGPFIVDFIADRQKAAGLTGIGLYHLSFRIMIALLVIAFVANELIRPLPRRAAPPDTRAAPWEKHPRTPADDRLPAGRPPVAAGAPTLTRNLAVGRFR